MPALKSPVNQLSLLLEEGIQWNQPSLQEALIAVEVTIHYQKGSSTQGNRGGFASIPAPSHPVIPDTERTPWTRRSCPVITDLELKTFHKNSSQFWELVTNVRVRPIWMGLVSPFPNCLGALGVQSPDPNPGTSPHPPPTQSLSFFFFEGLAGLGKKRPGKRHALRSMRNLDLQSFGNVSEQCVNLWSRHNKPSPGIASHQWGILA